SENLFLRQLGEIWVAYCMISHLKSQIVELANLVPSQVVIITLDFTQTLGHIKGGSKTIALKERRNVCDVRFRAIVEGQYNQAIGNRHQVNPWRRGCPTSEHQN